MDLQPQLLTQLLRQMLAARGLTALDLSAAAGEPVDVALLSGAAAPAEVEASVVVRLEQAGWDMPAVVQIDAPAATRPRAVELADVDDLVELLIALASE